MSLSVKEVVHQSWGLWEYLRAARTEGMPRGENFQTSGPAAFPFSLFSQNKLHFPRPTRLKEFTGPHLETVSLQQDLAFAGEKCETGKLCQGGIDLQVKLEIFLPKPAARLG